MPPPARRDRAALRAAARRHAPPAPRAAVGARQRVRVAVLDQVRAIVSASGRPRTSFALQPKSCSAAGLKSRIVSSGPSARKASGAVSTIARARASEWRKLASARVWRRRRTPTARSRRAGRSAARRPGSAAPYAGSETASAAESSISAMTPQPVVPSSTSVVEDASGERPRATGDNRLPIRRREDRMRAARFVTGCPRVIGACRIVLSRCWTGDRPVTQERAVPGRRLPG